MNPQDNKLNIFGKLAKYFSNQLQLTLLLILLIFSLGVVGIFSLPRESLPEIVFPSVIVQTVYPGASPEDVEYLITDKIENKINELDDIESIESETTFGISVVTISFREDVDIVQMKNEVDSALQELSFPDTVQEPKTTIFKTSSIPLMKINIAGDYSQIDLTDYASLVKDKVDSIVGVEEAVLSGGVTRQIEIIPNELKMMQYGVSYQNLKNALQGTNFSLPVGEVDLNGIRYNIRVDQKFEGISDIENTTVTATSGQTLYLKDIADVKDTIENVQSINRAYDQSLNDTALPSILLTVSRKVGSDVVGTSDAVKAAVNDMVGKQIPEDITISISNDLAQNVNKDISNIEQSALSGLLVVVIVLFIFIGFKEALVVSLTIPLSLLGTLGLLNLFGITFNTFAILGLIVALGLLVDNSIIVMENIDRLRKEGLSSKDAAIIGTDQVGFPITSSTFTTIAAFFPLAILPGILGAFVSTIPITIIMVILVSLLVSIVVTPSISARFLKESKRELPKRVEQILSIGLVMVLSFYAFTGSSSSIVLPLIMSMVFTLMIIYKLFFSEGGRIIHYYEKIVKWLVKRTFNRIVVVVSGLLILILSFSVFSAGLLKIAFFPQSEPTGLNISIDTVGGTPLEKTESVTQEVEEYLYTIEGVNKFTSTIGDDDAVINVELDNTIINGFKAIEMIDAHLATMTGAKYNVAGIVSGPPVGKPIEIQLVSDDLSSLREANLEVEKILTETPGIYNVESSSTTGVPEILLTLNESRSAMYGISGYQIASQLRSEINGEAVSTIRSGDDDVDIVLKKNLASIETANDIENLFIATQVSGMIPLSSLSDFNTLGGISNITHLEGERVIILTGDLREGYNASETTEALRQVFKDYDKVTVRFAGDVEGIEQNFGNLFQSMILAVFLVFIILTLQFKSISQPFIILLTIPMAVIGVILGLTLTGNDFGFYAFMGLVALVGIAVNDAIVLIDYMNALRQEGVEVKEAIVEAGKTRFNPVFATTLTTISGLLPLAFKEVYYAEFSFALIFGLMITTLLTLIFIPTVYGLFEIKKGGVAHE